VTPEALASTSRGAVVAAAGCGKTDLIARSVAVAPGRQLVLTHTNAGVDAIRRRLRRCGVAADRIAVDTIHGWCLKYIVAYPQRSGGLPVGADGGTNWNAICPSMANLLETPTVRKVVKASYDGLYVDEYQDCDEPQHELVRRLSDFMSTRILGDPLQAVFRFAGELPPWTAEVEASFPRVATLTTPWRWQRQGENRELGDWLIEVRGTLEARRGLDLRDPCIRFVQTPSARGWGDLAQELCFEAARDGGTVAAIMKWASGYLVVGRLTGGSYQCVEPISAKDAAKCLTALEAAPAAKRSSVIVEHLERLATGTEEPLAAVAAARGSGGFTEDPLVFEAARHLETVDAGGTPGAAAEALDALVRLPGLRVYRRELLWATIDSLRDADGGGYVDLLDSLRRRRNLTSHIGRRLSRRTAGSTLLLKGMEFDHAIVIDTGDFSLSDLYVALTRASRTLTVLSPTPVIDPRRLRAK
jgi:hypothetical protein